MAVCICDGHHFSTTTISTYHKNISNNQVESYGHPNLRWHSISTFELSDILLGSIGHPSQNFRVSEFSLHFLVLVFLWSCLSTQSTIVSSIPSLWICHYDFLTREDPRRTGPHQRFSGPFNQRSGIFPFFLVNGYAYFFPSF